MTIHELFAYIHVKNAVEAIAFYTAVFGATEKFRLVEPGGRMGHAELDFAGTTLMLSEAFPEYGILAPQAGAPAFVTLHLHVDNCDEVIARALKAGATLEMAAQDHFYGERSGSFRDPSGHRWSVGHSIEDVTPAEMQRRYTAMMTTPAT
ncbi:MAG: VOC family protein [Polaromonas sp.]|uniref:VOC family protein n=1 Tax=Polaromonas sp. TaxID=1869339 RepID=UPI00248706EF|nr:VOC family protein [Polaromonas sp.]MDI1236932.1 VOC family protein [Polaromonas sp.]